MTAEITIMNKAAIVLAADSAVTVGEDRIYNSANKLFTLSKVNPVGIMVYQNADFMGVPWESIIKVYRRDLGKTEFKSLNDYVKHFINYIENNRLLFSEDTQLKYFRLYSGSYLRYIREQIRKKFEEENGRTFLESISSGKPRENVDEKKIFTDIIGAEWGRLNKCAAVPNLKDLDPGEIIKKHDKSLDALINTAFEKSPLDEEFIKKLKEVTVNRFIKDTFIPYTGVVIAGFGADDVYPGFSDFRVESIFENKLKCSEPTNNSASSGALIQFFAQSDKGESFIRGIDPDLSAYSKKASHPSNGYDGGNRKTGSGA